MLPPTCKLGARIRGKHQIKIIKHSMRIMIFDDGFTKRAKSRRMETLGAGLRRDWSMPSKTNYSGEAFV